MASIMAGRTDIGGDRAGASPRLGNIRRDSDMLNAVMTVSDAPLTMYTTTWCGFCPRLKTALKAEGIA